MVKLVPVAIAEPPVAAVYQFTVPADAVAPSVTVPEPQTLPGVVPVIVGYAFTVIAAVLPLPGVLLQPPKVNPVIVITGAPLVANAVVVNVPVPGLPAVKLMLALPVVASGTPML